jgi:hypothetical protein
MNAKPLIDHKFIADIDGRRVWALLSFVNGRAECFVYGLADEIKCNREICQRMLWFLTMCDEIPLNVDLDIHYPSGLVTIIPRCEI